MTIQELINQFQREISSAVHDLGAVSAFSKKLPQCQVDQLNREFIRLSHLLGEAEKKIKKASAQISQGNEQWGGSSFSTINTSSPNHQQTLWDGVKKEFVKALHSAQAVSTAFTLISLTPPQIPTVPEQQTDSSYVEFQEPNFCSLEDKIDPEELPVVQQYESMPEIARVRKPDSQLEEIYTQQKEAEVEKRKKKLEVFENQDIASGSPPPDPT